MWKSFFSISRLFWQEEVFALLQFAHDCDFCQKLAAPEAFQCQQKTDRTAWQLVRSGMLENRLISSFRCFLDLLFQRFSWSPPFRYILGVTLADIPFPFPSHPCRYPFQQVWVRCAQNSSLPTFGELNISSCCACSRNQYVRGTPLSAISGDLVLSSANLDFLIMISIQSKALTPRWQIVSKVFATKSGKIQTYWKAVR